MTASEFFIEIIAFAGTSLKAFTEILFEFSPVNVVLSVLFGVLVFGIVLSILRGRKL